MTFDAPLKKSVFQYLQATVVTCASECTANFFTGS